MINIQLKIYKRKTDILYHKYNVVYESIALHTFRWTVTFTLNIHGCIKSKETKQKPQQWSKKISNDQELIQSDPTSCPQNQKGNN